MPNPKKPRTPCPVCGKEPYGASYKYCSNACQSEYQNRLYIEKWRTGEVSGLQTIGIVSRPLKRYLRKKFNNKCCLCGWARVNPSTGVVPLVADHIDGNWRNNKEANLRLICPNCDALSGTFGNLNKGKGRDSRAGSRRAAEGKLLARKRKL